MNAIRSMLAITWKELQILAKDRGALAVLFLMPLLFASLIGSMNLSMAKSAAKSATGATQAPTVEIFLINQDGGPYGAQVTQVLNGLDFLRVEELTNVADADRQLAEGQTKKLAAVVITSDFSQMVDAYERTSVEVIVDPTKKDFAGIVTGIMNNVVAEITLQGEIRYGIRSVMAETKAFDQADPQVRRMIEGQSLGAIMTQLQAMRQQPAISVRSEDLAGAEEERTAWNPFSWEMPAFTVMFTFFLVSTIAASIWMEREGGMFRRLLTAPLSRSTLIAGKMLAYVIVVFLQVAVMFGVGRLAFDMPLGSSPLGLLLMTLALALAATSLGMLVAALARSEKQADSLGVLLGFVLAGIGGCLMPFFSGDYGSLMKTVSQFTPHAHALVGYINLIEHNASLTQILPQIGAVLAFAAAFFGVSVWRLKLN